MNAIAWHFPYLYFILKYTPIRAIQDAVTASRLLYAEGQAAVTNSRDTSSVKNLFANVLAQAEKSEGGLTDEEIFVEAGSFCIAGTDTTGNTLTYLIWAVLKQPELQKALQEEVGGVKEPLSDVELAKLPVLNAVIAETLRLYGAAPGALLRVAPPEGAVLGGYTVPGGTVVSTQAWSLHRDPELFPDPEKYTTPFPTYPHVHSNKTQVRPHTLPPQQQPRTLRQSQSRILTLRRRKPYLYRHGIGIHGAAHCDGTVLQRV